MGSETIGPRPRGVEHPVGHTGWAVVDNTCTSGAFKPARPVERPSKLPGSLFSSGPNGSKGIFASIRTPVLAPPPPVPRRRTVVGSGGLARRWSSRWRSLQPSQAKRRRCHTSVTGWLDTRGPGSFADGPRGRAGRRTRSAVIRDRLPVEVIETTSSSMVSTTTGGRGSTASASWRGTATATVRMPAVAFPGLGSVEARSWSPSHSERVDDYSSVTPHPRGGEHFTSWTRSRPSRSTSKRAPVRYGGR